MHTEHGEQEAEAKGGEEQSDEQGGKEKSKPGTVVSVKKSHEAPRKNEIKANTSMCASLTDKGDEVEDKLDDVTETDDEEDDCRTNTGHIQRQGHPCVERAKNRQHKITS